MKSCWRAYFFLVLLYDVGMAVIYGVIDNHFFTITDVLYVLFYIGLFGLAFARRILTQNTWRYIFVVAAIKYIHEWIVLPSVLWFSKGIPVLDILAMMIYSVPLLPLFYGLYLYAWRSERLWRPINESE